MIISCPSCTARYQLADSKVKTSGTRVRCPRCSHTFTVHPRREEDDISERTELFVRRDDILSGKAKTGKSETDQFFDEKPAKPEPPKRVESKPPAPESKVKAKPEPKPEPKPKPKPKPEPKPEPEDDLSEDVFDQKTMVSTEAPEDILSKLKRTKKPKDDPARVVSPKEIEDDPDDTWDEVGKVQDADENDSVDGLEMELAQDSSKTGSRPFGEATMLELRKVGKKSRQLAKFAKPVAAGLLLVSCLYGIYILIQQIDFSQIGSDSSEQSSGLLRPERWYRDEPGIYQDQLARIAALPKPDQERVENRALLAEALILNGLLTDAKDQVLSGLGIASGISLTQPDAPFGFYGISAYAIGNRDDQMMIDLLNRWPEDYRYEPEYKLLEVVALAAQNKEEQALTKAQALIQQNPDFQRANNYSLVVALRSLADTQKVLSEGVLETMIARYKVHREKLEASLDRLPRVYTEIDRRLERNKLGSGSKEPEPQEETQEPVQKTVAPEVPEPKPEPEPAPDLKPPPPNPLERRASPTKLPREDRQLIARNRAAQNDRAAAAKLFEEGNQVYKDGAQDKALELYREALRKDPEFADAYRQIGTIYMARKQPERALKSFKIYLTLRPQSDDKQMVESWIKSLE